MARKILLADDSVTAQNMGRKILADAGYEVVTVNNGSAALKKISEQRPDVIVLDVYMPGYSGLEVCQRLKETGETSRIPILLTVGKLEPFKPEEAKRVRADGFIVKPFEASELLSALSKLEDKVVPRADSSKTGRFARATAAIEENRYDKSAGVEHDSSWKTRIQFPKKKEAPAKAEAEDPSIYSAVNKDLRTTVENKPVEASKGAVSEEERVDVGALAAAGLPKDVTPEEIAALAAAAAQVKGKLAETKAPEPAPGMAVVKPAEAEAPKQEIKTEAPAPEPVPVPAVEAAPVATFAEQTPEKAEEKEKETEPEVAASPAAVTAAIAGLESDAVSAAASANGSSAASEKTPEPVTMAVAAAAQAAPAGPRWTAVAVAVAPEEAGVSLEQEMRKMYAGYAAAEADRTVMMRLPEIPPILPTSTVPASVPEPVSAPTPAPVEPVATAAIVSAPAEIVPQAAETMSAVATAATEAMSAAVAELESVAASYAAEQPSTPAEAATPPAEARVAPSAPETPQFVEAKAEEAPTADVPAAAAELAAQANAEEITPRAEIAEPPAVETEAPQAITEEPPSKEETQELPVIDAAVAESPAIEPPVPEAAVEVPHEQANVTEVSEEPTEPAQNRIRAGGLDDMAKRESETAAAWASWRKIRETGDSKSIAGSSSNESDEAAMAVAAGAEHKPEDVGSLDSDPEISSIVDSVLADMRPKIVEEIARKLGKKK